MLVEKYFGWFDSQPEVPQNPARKESVPDVPKSERKESQPELLQKVRKESVPKSERASVKARQAAQATGRVIALDELDIRKVAELKEVNFIYLISFVIQLINYKYIFFKLGIWTFWFEQWWLHLWRRFEGNFSYNGSRYWWCLFKKNDEWCRKLSSWFWRIC